MGSVLAPAGLPTLNVLVSILLNNIRLGDFESSVDQRFRDIDRRFNAIDRRFDQQRDSFRSDLFRVEQVIDTRLKHLEEHR